MRKDSLSAVRPGVLDAFRKLDRGLLRIERVVGYANTQADLLAAMYVPNTRSALLVIKASEMTTYRNTYYVMREDGVDVPSITFAQESKIITAKPIVHVVSDGHLSRPDGAKLLDDIRPDLIVCRQFSHNAVKQYRISDYCSRSKCRVVQWYVGGAEAVAS